jgi:hypothetical protein
MMLAALTLAGPLLVEAQPLVLRGGAQPPAPPPAAAALTTAPLRFLGGPVAEGAVWPGPAIVETAPLRLLGATPEPPTAAAMPEEAP